MTKINDDVERLYYRLDYDDIVQAFQAAQDVEGGFGEFLERCANQAFDDDGDRCISVSEFTDEDIKALWNYYKSRKHAEE